MSRPDRPGVRAAARVFGRRHALPAIAVIPQIAPVWLAGALTGQPALAAAAPVALTAAFLAARGAHRGRPRSRLHLYVALWPFFAWWTACFTFTLLAPLAALVGAVAGVLPQAIAAAGAVAAVQGGAAVRRTPRVARVRVAIPDLPPELDGTRIVHISDVHCGDFAPARRVRDWVRRANAQRADVAAVTGDLITHGDRHIDAVASALADLRAPGGVFACMGNHDYYGDGARLADALERGGVRVLRNESARVFRGGAELAVAGVDDTWSGRADLARALAGAPPGAFVVLLAHDPDLFRSAADRGVPLTLSGHTHGGQLAVPLFARRYNLARLAHEFTSGLYRRGRSALYVNRGVGTSGPPIRIGTRGELAVITLRREGPG